jgi:pyrimidine-nucleoside phosphorylase
VTFVRTLDLIAKKRDGGEHTEEELRALVNGYTRGDIPDYQMSAWLMAVIWRGLSDRETFALTGAMAASGDTLDLSSIPGIPVDKHSTGGVGDKTTLAVVPILASAGVPVAKMSGRGLGHTGGTLDKLESVPGVRVNLTVEEILAQVQRVGACLCAQTEALVPADRKLYALRDATATVESLPLIAASIMSKKLACGAPAIVLDVKFGGGAFMKSVEDARALADLMIRIGRAHGRRVAAVLSDMDQPLGYAIGNRLEVNEAFNLLRGGAFPVSPRFKELVVSLSAIGFLLAARVKDLEEGRALALEQINTGAGYQKFWDILNAQGGDVNAFLSLDHSTLLTWNVLMPEPGYVSHVSAEVIGQVAMRLGAGRATKEDVINPETGILLSSEAFGHLLPAGHRLATLYASDEATARAIAPEVLRAFTFSDQPPTEQPLIYDTLGLDES